MKYTIFFLVLYSLFTSGAYGQQTLNNEVLKSHCAQLPESALQSWLQLVADQIKRGGHAEHNRGFDEQKNVFDGKNLSVAFRVKADATGLAVYDVRVRETSGLKAVDQSAVSLIKSASPFQLCRNSLIIEKDIFVDFHYPNVVVSLDTKQATAH